MVGQQFVPRTVRTDRVPREATADPEGLCSGLYPLAAVRAQASSPACEPCSREVEHGDERVQRERGCTRKGHGVLVRMRCLPKPQRSRVQA